MLYLTYQNFGFPNFDSQVHIECSPPLLIDLVIADSAVDAAAVQRVVETEAAKATVKAPPEVPEPVAEAWQLGGKGSLVERSGWRKIWEMAVSFFKLLELYYLEILNEFVIFSWFKIPIPFRFCFFLPLPPKNGGPNTSRQVFFGGPIALKKKPPDQAAPAGPVPVPAALAEFLGEEPSAAALRGAARPWATVADAESPPETPESGVKGRGSLGSSAFKKKRSTMKQQKIGLGPFCREICGKMCCQAVILCCQVPHGVFLLIHWEQEEHSIQTLCFLLVPASFWCFVCPLTARLRRSATYTHTRRCQPDGCSATFGATCRDTPSACGDTIRSPGGECFFQNWDLWTGLEVFSRSKVEAQLPDILQYLWSSLPFWLCQLKLTTIIVPFSNCKHTSESLHHNGREFL